MTILTSYLEDDHPGRLLEQNHVAAADASIMNASVISGIGMKVVKGRGTMVGESEVGQDDEAI